MNFVLTAFGVLTGCAVLLHVGVAGIAESVLLFGLFALWVLHTLQRQGDDMVQVRDDVRLMDLADLVRGDDNPDTRFYADCATLCANAYVSSAVHTQFEDEAAARQGTLRHETNWQRVEEIPTPSGASIHVEVWRLDTERTLALVVRGSANAKLPWLLDLHWLKYLLPGRDQFDELADILPGMLSAIADGPYAGYDIIATGHGVGGGLAHHAVMLNQRIQRAYVFNSTPFTGSSKLDPVERQDLAADHRVYRFYDSAWASGRLFRQFSYLLAINVNAAPHCIEHRVNLTKQAVGIQHQGVHSIAMGLQRVKEGRFATVGTGGSNIP